MFGAGPYTVADVLASPLIATPLHRLDCCLMNEGGGALVDHHRRTRARPAARARADLGGGMEFLQGNYANPPLYRADAPLGQARCRSAPSAGAGERATTSTCSRSTIRCSSR